MDNQSKKQQKTDTRTEIEDNRKTETPDPLVRNIPDTIHAIQKLTIRHLMLLLISSIRCYSKL
jgi:hypothetical protein